MSISSDENVATSQEDTTPSAEAEEISAPVRERSQEERAKTFDADYVSALRQEAARYRTERKELEEQLKQTQQHQIAEREKLIQQIAEHEKRYMELQEERQRLQTKSAVTAQAAAMQIIDPEAAYVLLDHKQLQYDENGVPQNVAELLSQLVEQKPYLLSPKGMTTMTAHPGRTEGLPNDRAEREQQLRNLMQGGMQGNVWDIDRIRAHIPEEKKP